MIFLFLFQNRRTSCSWADELKRVDERPSEFNFGFAENDFESNKNMTLDPRLLSGNFFQQLSLIINLEQNFITIFNLIKNLSGKRPLRDRLSLGVLGKGKLSYYSQESAIPTSATTVSKIYFIFRARTQSLF